MNRREEVFITYKTTMASSSIQHLDSDNCPQLQLLVLLNYLFLANMEQIVFGIQVSLNSQFYRLEYNSCSEKLEYFMLMKEGLGAVRYFWKAKRISRNPQDMINLHNSQAISGIALLASNQRLF